MRLIRLTPRARHRLQRLARSGSNARSVRRAQALLWLDRGESVATIAQHLIMSRQTIYNWVERYKARRSEPVDKRVCDRSHPGRPDRKLRLVLKVVEPLLKRNPRRYGYRSATWTVPVLRQRVRGKTELEVSQRTVRRALRKTRYRYKRPRYSLAKRPSTWRQAKGGLKGV